MLISVVLQKTCLLKMDLWTATVFEYFRRAVFFLLLFHLLTAGMSAAAASQDILIQFCMPLPSDFMASTQLSAVTQIRVSDDYAVALYDQWRIGGSSMLAWAVGLQPFKDVFRSTQLQKGNPLLHQEPNSELHALVATLSTGPVAIGDKIGDTNTTLVAWCCSKNGTILKPSRPATAVELTYVSTSHPTATPQGEVWTTYSLLPTTSLPADVRGDAKDVVWSGHVFAAALNSDFNLTFRHSGLGPGRIGWVKDDSTTQWVAMPWRATLGGNTSSSFSHAGVLKEFSDAHPVVLQACPKGNGSIPLVPYQHVLAYPVRSGWVLLGEMGKFVPTSPARFLQVRGEHAALAMGVPTCTCYDCACIHPHIVHSIGWLIQ
eukprot:m.385739 g.385739  ORF g.385739 m.385739 type:complete len:375 (+) comp21011_c1_seq3:1688-2812(+)